MNSYNWTGQMVVCNEPSGKERLEDVWKKGTQVIGSTAGDIHHEWRKLAPQTFTKASGEKTCFPVKKSLQCRSFSEIYSPVVMQQML